MNLPTFNGHLVKGILAWMEVSMNRKEYKRYSREFKLEAVRLAALGERPRTLAAMRAVRFRPFSAIRSP
jgi:hypothetical protein